MSKETVEKYLKEVNEKIWKDSPSMQAYCRKKCSDVLETESGYLVEFERPEIKTRFCFGHGYCGITSQEESERAFDCAEIARTQEDYFLKENLEQYDEWLDAVEKCEKFYLYKCRKDTKTASIVPDYALYGTSYLYQKECIIGELTVNDVVELERIILSEKEKFTKRLRTYLKRYGLSKIHAWTYLVD